ncbi:MAG: cupredoxin domain-containing protein [Candidatus Dormibacterales bacterium]
MGALAAAILAACFGVGPPPPATVSGVARVVHVLDDPITVGDFSPSTVTIHVGQSVAWINDSGDWHSVTFSGPGMPNHRSLAPKGVWVHGFTRPGVFRYRCLYHPGMEGVVVVLTSRGPGGSPPTASPAPTP